MTSRAAGSQLASRFGLSERVFVGPAARAMAAKIEAGLELVETQLGEELASADPLVDATSRYLYEAGGKRVRPMLVLLTAQLGDGATQPVIDAAKALELMHLGSLYHDDVMDGADRRRGVAAAHQVWGRSVAILTGDLLLSRASTILARNGVEAMKIQAETFERLVMGQIHETVGPQPGDDEIGFYLQVLADKTGSLIAAAARAGAFFSGAEKAYREPLRAFGEAVGVSFQLADDVIDLSDHPDDTGKVPGTDLRAGVKTMPYLLLQRREDAASLALKNEIDRGVARIEDGADPAILDGAITRLRDHEVTAETVELSRGYTDRAIAHLEVLPRGAVKQALVKFAESLAVRTK
ncbi:MAG: polyprenyl synthetase family protein [Microbacterium sp.]